MKVQHLHRAQSIIAIQTVSLIRVCPCHLLKPSNLQYFTSSQIQSSIGAILHYIASVKKLCIMSTIYNSHFVFCNIMNRNARFTWVLPTDPTPCLILGKYSNVQYSFRSSLTTQALNYELLNTRMFTLSDNWILVVCCCHGCCNYSVIICVVNCYLLSFIVITDDVQCRWL